MKKNKEVSDLKSKNKKDLFIELSKTQKKLTQLRFSLTFRKLKNVHEISDTKKKIARIWTILSEKTLEQLDEKRQTKVAEKDNNGQK